MGGVKVGVGMGQSGGQGYTVALDTVFIFGSSG